MYINSVMDRAKEITSLKGVSQSELDLWSQKLICILGPSGVGKSTLCYALTKMFPNRFYLMGSTITHPPGSKEMKFNNYRKVTQGTFLRMISEDAFLHWNEARSGFYGLEKGRIRASINSQENLLIVFRALSGGIMKSILPKMTVIELRASVETLKQRIQNRNRMDDKTIGEQIKSAARDLVANDVMFKYWSERAGGNWYQIQNEINYSPISPETVHQALYVIDKSKN